MEMTAPAEPKGRVNEHRAASAQAALRVRQMEFDRSKLAEHRALLAFVKKLRSQLDRAGARLKGKPNAARRIEQLQAAQQPALEKQIAALQAMDPTSDRSHVTADHATNLNFLTDEYPAALIGALSGDPHPLQEIRAELARHEQAIEQWLAQLPAR
jgi:hypothetical protein